MEILNMTIRSSEFDDKIFTSIQSVIKIFGDSEVIIKVNKSPDGGGEFVFTTSTEGNDPKTSAAGLYFPIIAHPHGIQVASINDKLASIKNYLKLMSDNIVFVEEKLD